VCCGLKVVLYFSTCSFWILCFFSVPPCSLSSVQARQSRERQAQSLESCSGDLRAVSEAWLTRIALDALMSERKSKKPRKKADSDDSDEGGTVSEEDGHGGEAKFGDGDAGAPASKRPRRESQAQEVSGMHIEVPLSSSLLEQAPCTPVEKPPCAPVELLQLPWTLEERVMGGKIAAVNAAMEAETPVKSASVAAMEQEGGGDDDDVIIVYGQS
jgi:hypothetical protein